MNLLMEYQTGKIYSLKNSYISLITFTVSYAGPTGPIEPLTNSARDAVVGNPASDVVNAKLALTESELLNGTPKGKNEILIYY